MLRTRILSSLVMVPIVFVSIYIGGYPLLVGLAVLSIVATMEFSRLMGLAGFHPYPLVSIALGLVFMLDAFFGTNILRPALTAFLLLSIVWSARTKQKDDLVNWALTFTGGIYCGGLLSYGVLLRNMSNGFEWLMLVVGSAAAADVFAYFIGSAIGKRLLAPKISPGKTWEGMGAGMLAGVGLAVALALVFQLPMRIAVSVGLLVAVADLVGDLVESKFKRLAGVKDSGTLIPGHGGVLDRMDGQLFAWPIAYYSILVIMRMWL